MKSLIKKSNEQRQYKLKMYQKIYRTLNRERAKVVQRKYRKDYPEYQIEYRKTHREKAKAYQKIYRKANPEKLKEFREKYRKQKGRAK